MEDLTKRRTSRIHLPHLKKAKASQISQDLASACTYYRLDKAKMKCEGRFSESKSCGYLGACAKGIIYYLMGV